MKPKNKSIFRSAMIGLFVLYSMAALIHGVMAEMSNDGVMEVFVENPVTGATLVAAPGHKYRTPDGTNRKNVNAPYGYGTVGWSGEGGTSVTKADDPSDVSESVEQLW